MNKDKFLELAGDHLPALRDVVYRSVTSYPEKYLDTLEIHSKRTQACLIYDHMIRTAKEILPQSHFVLVDVNQRKLFNYKDMLLLQFKKLNESLRTSNAFSHQNELFEQYGEVEGLFGPCILPLITVGYIPKPFLAGVEGVFVTRTVGHAPAWTHRIDGEDDLPAISSILQQSPTPQHGRKSRIRRKNTEDGAAEGAA